MIRYPYHRYLRYLVLEGEDAAAICDHLVDLAYTPPTEDEVADLISSIREGRVVDDHLREEHEVLFFDEGGASLDGMYLIVESPEVRTMAESLLLDRLNLQAVATILSHRFDEKLSMESVEKFRDGFWDTVSLSNLDFYKYFKAAGKRVRQTDTGAIQERPHIAAWEHGVHPTDDDLSVDDMIRSVTVDSFMHFKKSQEIPTPENAQMARGWASTFMAAARASKSARIAGARSKAMSIKPILKYNDGETPSLSDLHRHHAESNLGTGHIVDETAPSEKSDPDAA